MSLFTPGILPALSPLELHQAKPKPRFTVGIYDDVTNLSLPLPENTLPSHAKLEALFYGLGSDGSVSAPISASPSSGFSSLRL